MNHSHYVFSETPLLSTTSQLRRPTRLSVRPAIGRRGMLSLLVVLVLSVGFMLTSPQTMAQTASAVSPELVNINAADVQTLVTQLKGVGPARAQEIVRHRETFGPFASTDELIEVKGIGQSTLDMNRSRITLE